MISYDSNDRHSVALCATKEARGEGQAGMRAVMHIIANRVGHPGFASNIHDVVYGKNQFSSMSVPTDPQFNWSPKLAIDVSAFNFCMSVADSILQGQADDITKGAHYYANLKDVSSSWFKDNISGPTGEGLPEHPRTAMLGNHVFFL